MGRTDRVTYRLGEWQAPRRRLAVGEYVVRLEGFRSQHDDTLTVVGWNHHRLTLLVIAPETGPEVAGHVLATAADENNTDDSSQLLTARGTTAARSRTTDGAPLPA
ncbi:DUF5994 family protein [Amycolatopsis sp. NPDC049691]|uniref:DUF5994 family protein n=1 Tax=Amycolatopsis sp. NPDC049691 TaxID=3155155 RepID=UPI00342194C0